MAKALAPIGIRVPGPARAVASGLYKNVSTPCTSEPGTARDSAGVGTMSEQKKEAVRVQRCSTYDEAPDTGNFCIFESLCSPTRRAKWYIATVARDIQKIIRVFPASSSVPRRRRRPFRATGFPERDNIDCVSATIPPGCRALMSVQPVSAVSPRLLQEPAHVHRCKQEEHLCQNQPARANARVQAAGPPRARRRAVPRP